ncbi:MAG: tetratricopeptide repeat protein [Candidatus Nitrohelix vancouverensis]|uniref:Tetratricopeptide repeat protein n=1 Tax=Candidatus Nitrohelix vancouverensis TaxID=2705534 RepID=A0A7T0G407_9BACT|nr:MAG: tetratricopeptide repeat protein [Candidatus Nitrohelix vancouverensis]
MAKHERISRKQIVKTPDQFLTQSDKIIHYLSDRQPTVIASLVGLFLLLGAYWGFTAFQKSNMESQEILLSQMQSEQEKSAENASGVLKGIYEKLDSPTHKTRGALMLADAFYREKKYDEAQKIYDSVIADTKPSEIQYQVAQVGLASILEVKKQYPQAIDYYRSLIDMPEIPPTSHVYFSLARCYKLNNDSKGALLVLREMKNKFSGNVIGKVDAQIQALEKEV